MNIAIGKSGRSIIFNIDRRSYTSGDEEAPMMYRLLAERHPEHTFYLIGKSDLTRLRRAQAKAACSSLDSFFGDDTEESTETSPVVPSNIIDLFDGIPSENEHVHILNKIERLGLKFDLGIIYTGPSPSVGIPDVGIKLLDESGRDASPLVMFKRFYAPIFHTINTLKFPYIRICGDPRYVPPMGRDILHDEAVTLSQINGVFPRQRLITYTGTEQRIANLKFVYGAVETIFMLDEKKIDFRLMNKTNRFVVGLNGGFSRDTFIESWVLNQKNLDEIKVYGKWDEKYTNAYPNVFEDKAIKEVESVFWNSRYTIIPPPHNATKKDILFMFVTQKFWKMIHYGIIPFFHPQYDITKIFDVPEILRIKNPSEMWSRIEYLDSHPDEYSKILNGLYDRLDDSFYNGDHLHNTIQSTLREYVGFTL